MVANEPSSAKFLPWLKPLVTPCCLPLNFFVIPNCVPLIFGKLITHEFSKSDSLSEQMTDGLLFSSGSKAPLTGFLCSSVTLNAYVKVKDLQC